MAGILNTAETLSPSALTAWLRDLRKHAYARQSHFLVAAVFRARTPAGIVHVGGANVENPDLTLGTCGEESAMAALVTAYGPEVEILEGWVMGAPADATTSQIPCTPCGECRQRLAHFAGADAPIHAITLDGATASTATVGALLPNAFSFRNLEEGTAKTRAADILHKHSPEAASGLLARHGTLLDTAALLGWLRQLQSDARATKRHQAVILRSNRGAYVAGTRIENAAYPSSTEAAQAAVANLRGIYGPNDTVAEAWVLTRSTTAVEDPFALSGGELQVLWEAAGCGNIPLHYGKGDALARSERLQDAMRHAPKFGSAA